ncbi:hypothetical protein Cgig2_028566 [Carnegiea gigantea]|uniref:Uncharacterized protein n=1 Tax=Carnegiea gigantea TaxID=171969 RepID=A0A9Q1K3P7_9CARY|nr:hypothetical protein Cgig2_028566 [Carnegiea gigantea]
MVCSGTCVRLSYSSISSNFGGRNTIDEPIQGQKLGHRTVKRRTRSRATLRLLPSLNVCSTSPTLSKWEGKARSLGSSSLTPQAKKVWPQEDPSHEVMAEGTYFPSAPNCSDPSDGPRTLFPNQKVVRSLKRSALEEKYLLPMGYKSYSRTQT